MPKKDDLPYMMGLKLRLYPNWKQEKILWKNLNASRFIYNQLLANSWTDSRIIKNKLDKRYPIPEAYCRYGKNGKVIKKSQKRPTGLARITAQRYPWLDDDLDSDMFTNTEVIRPLGICFGKYTLPENQSLSEKAVLFSHIRLLIIIRVQL